MMTMLRHNACILFLTLCATWATAGDPWTVYEGDEGPGKGKHIVLVSGDEEYRSEETMPMLGKLLAVRHGFRCTVLFAIDPETGEIKPDYLHSIPGLQNLKSADLMVINTRFRDLPPEQMKHLDAFLLSGRPVIALRPIVAGFRIKKHTDHQQYDWHYKGPEKAWHGGFGKMITGQTWIAHHGKHKHQGTRGLIAETARTHPIVRGIANGDIWGPSDVYRTPQPVPSDWTPLVMGQVQDRKGDFDPKDPFYGMKPDDPVSADRKKNDPMMPIAWLRPYQLPSGKPGTSFTSTIGSSTDFASEGLRRLVVNATYHLLGLTVPDRANADPVGAFKPRAYGFGTYTRGLKPEDHAL